MNFSPSNVFDIDRDYFPTELQLFQFRDKYSKFDYNLNRRENWIEAIRRSVDYLRELSGNKLSENDYNVIEESMLNMKAFPSMRLFANAGATARRDNTVLYNCSAVVIDCIDSMVEVLALGMSGSGVGYSVESRFVNQLPEVQYYRQMKPPSFLVVEDTTEGWLDAFTVGLTGWFKGYDLRFDYSNIRPAGAILYTKGGRASGHQVLADLLDYARDVILNAGGRKLTTLEVHDIITRIADISISGAIRRAALICHFDFDDESIRNCKSGRFWEYAPWRANSNNSAVWSSNNKTRKEAIEALHETLHGYSGEPGIYIRDNVNATALPTRDRSKLQSSLLNPCGERILRTTPKSKDGIGGGQFCNLSSAIARKEDTFETLAEKVRVATIIGTIQAIPTYFPNLRSTWTDNCNEERLIGVDINGLLDAEHLITAENLQVLKQLVLDTNKEYAKKLEINPAQDITCIKPSGNSSVLFDTSSGIHARWSPYYIRRTRLTTASPLYRVLQESGFTMYPENGTDVETTDKWVVEFPVKSPEGSITNGTRTALQQLEFWKLVKINWTTGNPSCTISYRRHEIEDIENWVYDNQDMIGGIAFLPYDDHIYPLAPYEAIDEDTYKEMVESQPKVLWELLTKYETEDHSTASRELACMSGVCEI